MDRLCYNLGIKTITLHGLRHTHTAMLQYKKVDIQSISKRLGHSSIRTTQEVYSHLMSEFENDENEKIKSVFDDLNKEIQE